MFDFIKKAYAKADFYASHCYGRIKSCIPLSLFYAANGLSGGGLKRMLSSLSFTINKQTINEQTISYGGLIPAGVTFLIHLWEFRAMLKKTHETHPDSMNHPAEKDQFIGTTDHILSVLQQDKESAKEYLAECGLLPEEISKLLNSRFSVAQELLYIAITTLQQRGEDPRKVLNIPANTVTEILESSYLSDEDKLEVFTIFYKIYENAHPHHIGFFTNLLDAVLHSATHLNEYLLLQYFQELDLLRDGWHWQLLGMALVTFGVLSGKQTFDYNKIHKNPSADKLKITIPEHFHLFKNPVTVVIDPIARAADEKKEQEVQPLIPKENPVTVVIDSMDRISGEAKEQELRPLSSKINLFKSKIFNKLLESEAADAHGCSLHCGAS